MVSIHPFRAVTPPREKAAEVSSVPFDVIDREEAKRIGTASESSFLHVIRPEIDFDDEVDPTDPRVFAQGKKSYDRLIDRRLLEREVGSSLYGYRLSVGGHSQNGLVACCSIEDYRSGRIRLHEHTRPAKLRDRVEHIVALGAHSGPVLMLFHNNQSVASALEGATIETMFDFETADGIRHEGWRIPQPRKTIEAFHDVDALYIGDGHHRSAAAEAVAQRSPLNPEANMFLAVLFAHDQIRIEAYHRYVSVPHDKRRGIVETISSRLGERTSGVSEPTESGVICVYDGVWRSFALPRGASEDIAAGLDVAVFDREILEPILGISDQRTDPRIDFEGGAEASKRLERRVDEEGGLAFTFYPVSVEDLMEVADSGSVMPPKSTWLAPKLRSGLFIHELT